MRNQLWLPVPALLLALFSAGPARSDDRWLVVLFRSEFAPEFNAELSDVSHAKPIVASRSGAPARPVFGGPGALRRSFAGRPIRPHRRGYRPAGRALHSR